MVENKDIKKLQHNLEKAISARNNCPVSKQRTLAQWCKSVDDLKSKILKKSKLTMKQKLIFIKHSLTLTQ